MGKLCIYTIYNEKSDRPRSVGIRVKGKTVFRHLYRSGEGKSVKEIFGLVKGIRQLILKANAKGSPILLSDFKQYLTVFKLPLTTKQYEVYDLNIPRLESSKSQEEDEATLIQVLDKMESREPQAWQKVSANAAVVYRDLEERGVLQNYTLQHPQWSMKTWSGRSKSAGFNVQGWYENDHIRTPGSNDTDVLIHFDWICADIRVASILANDRLMQKSFERSDPYEVMAKIINSGSDDPISRDECKIFLLKSINSMDFESVALSSVYKNLGKWIFDCKKTINNGQGGLKSMLGRKFRLADAKNELAVLNGVMQGSVAHAMQHTLRRVWEIIPHAVVTDIHDSLVICCNKDRGAVRAMINIVAPIMLHPFEGLIPENPTFPLKVSIGHRWKEWKHYKTYRGLDDETKEPKTARHPPEGSAQKDQEKQAETKEKTTESI
jgi:hypothetical protein